MERTAVNLPTEFLPKPTLGRIVLYRLTEPNADAINRRRHHAREHMPEHRANSNGVMVHVGNPVKVDDEFPMVITRVWGPEATSAINGTVMLDGSDTFWVTSAVHGNEAGRFRWPPRV